MVELTLTDGYARALVLDGERLRTEDRIRQLAGSDEHLGEVRILKARSALLEEELRTAPRPARLALENALEGSKEGLTRQPARRGALLAPGAASRLRP